VNADVGVRSQGTRADSIQAFRVRLFAALQARPELAEESLLMPTHERILVPLAEGFEEIEAVTIIDVLRRAGLEVTVAGLKKGSVQGSHGIVLTPDVELGALDLGEFTMIVLPGGMPGTRHLMADERVLDLVRRLHREGKRTAAICAAPLVLHAAGVIHGVAVTAHPSVHKELAGALVQNEPRVLHAGAVITSQGAGTAMEFALALVSDLCGSKKAEELGRSMVARGGA
jgi:4-methyl-5(b-hydroxyethyl)-thiazole monophosphate biosynthesis